MFCNGSCDCLLRSYYIKIELQLAFIPFYTIFFKKIKLHKCVWKVAMISTHEKCLIYCINYNIIR